METQIRLTDAQENVLRSLSAKGDDWIAKQIRRTWESGNRFDFDRKSMTFSGLAYLIDQGNAWAYKNRKA